MLTIPNCEPAELTAGDSWQWDRSLRDYSPADGWALEYVLVGGTRLRVAEGDGITAAGSSWQIRIPAAKTADLAAGTYRAAAYVSQGADRFEVWRSTVTVRANLATLTDGRSPAERELALVEDAIAGRLPEDMQSFQVNGRVVQRHDLAELYRIRGRLRSQVWRERNPGKLGPIVKVRFGGPY